MNLQRFEQVDEIFQAAVELDADRRAAFLDQACAGDLALRREVDALLAVDERAKSFIETPALDESPDLMTSDQSSTLAWESVGPFKIVALLGAGGMGEVYLAEDTRLGRNVALKLLRPDLIGASQSRQRFIREARLASALDHPNICTIHEIGEAEGLLFIAMQYVEGKTLAQLIGARPLAMDGLLSIGLQVGAGLAAAHARGIIHRDVKSNNIIVTSNGQAKVLDFGLAKPLHEDKGKGSELSHSGLVMGTPAYMSPEQARGERVDRRSDIFSFGVVIYEMATGRTPFAERSRAETMNAVINRPHAPVAELNDGAPARLSQVVDRALAKEPADRYQSIEEMISDLRNIAAQAGIRVRRLGYELDTYDAKHGLTAHYEPPRQTLMSRSVSWFKRPMRRVAMALPAIVTLALLAYFLWQKHSPPAPTIKSIAVLPFKPLVAANRDESLELGMADTLIARLSNLGEINVRPISAVRKYAGLEQDAASAGREQKVDAVVDGQLQQSGDKIRVTVRLVRVRDGATLFASQIDEKMTDIFAVQDSISERVAGALAVKLSPNEKERLAKRHTENTDAYRLYLLGRYHLNRLTDDGFLKGRDYFQQAIDIDANYALAYVGLADAYNRLSGWNALPPKDGFQKARAAAMKAIDLDDRLAEAHTSLGAVRLFYDWDWQGAETEFRRALEINQSYSDAHQMYSYYLSAMGRFDEALAEMKRAQDLDPISLEKVAGIAEIFFFRRQYDQATDRYQKALEMDPNSGFTHWALGNVYLQRRMYKEAIGQYQKSIPLSGESPDEPASLGYAYALSGKRQEAQQVLAELKERSKRRYIPPTSLAIIYSGLGEKDQAFAWLDKAYDGRDSLLVLLKVEPMFDGLRDDPRFDNLLQRVGLAQ
ncbi:MAG TPA: protein kinase [Blastocatellia bacterium]|nr:protein kinase [Blastocatellia bacterium]